MVHLLPEIFPKSDIGNIHLLRMTLKKFSLHFNLLRFYPWELVYVSPLLKENQAKHLSAVQFLKLWNSPKLYIKCKSLNYGQKLSEKKKYLKTLDFPVLGGNENEKLKIYRTWNMLKGNLIGTAYNIISSKKAY